jgi:glycosyltransferase involved in cell wall biosynthesis
LPELAENAIINLMRILFVHDFYRNFAGEDSVAVRERALLERYGESVLFYGKDNNETNTYNLLQKARFFPRTIFSGKTRTEVKNMVRKFRPDVAYIHNIFPLISPSLYHTLREESVPSVQNVGDFRWFCPSGVFYRDNHICEECKKGAYWNAVYHRCFRESYVLSGLYAASIGVNRKLKVLDKIDGMICMTRFSREKLAEVGVKPERLFIKPNFIDPSDIAPSIGTGRYALFLGRLSKEKGLWTMVRAFEEVKELQLRIVGTGPLEEDLRRYIAERNLTNISLDGFLQGSEKVEIVRNGLFTIFPSEWYENFPIVILESFAAGKPIIASRLGSIGLIVEDRKGGLHFEPGNERDLAEKIRWLASNPQQIEKMGTYNRRLVETVYGPEENYNTLTSIFKKVIR